MKGARELLGTVLLPALLAACVTMPATHVSTGWSRDSTILYLSVPTDKLEFNWHGGGVLNESTEYTITLARGRMEFRGADIQVGREGNSGSSPVHPDSLLTFANRCAFTVHVLDEQGRPYPFNGTYQLERWDCVK